APIDVAASFVAGDVPDTLLLGAGREELLRISETGERLASLATGLNHPDPATRAGAAADLWSAVAGIVPDLSQAIARFSRAGRGLLRISSALPSWEFHLHEGDGMVPLGRAIGRLRREVQAILAPPAPLRPTPDQTGPRFVNIDLSQTSPDGGRESIP